jgi:hypothetical protein
MWKKIKDPLKYILKAKDSHVEMWGVKEKGRTYPLILFSARKSTIVYDEIVLGISRKQEESSWWETCGVPNDLLPEYARFIAEAVKKYK